MDSTQVTLIGVDCATQPSRTGLALGRLEGETAVLSHAMMGSKIDVAQQVASWINNSPYPVLLALDAPLGWPQDLGTLLATHEAGQPLTVPPNTLFRRDTDRFIKEKLGKQSLDVGADRIARTAHAALTLLAGVRHQTGQPIPLAWQENQTVPVRAAEVYPAATLASLGIRVRGYRQHETARRELLGLLSPYLTIACDPAILLAEVDALDAALCVLAAADLLRGWCYLPHNLPLARKEGWMWVRRKEIF